MAHQASSTTRLSASRKRALSTIRQENRPPPASSDPLSQRLRILSCAKPRPTESAHGLGITETAFAAHLKPGALAAQPRDTESSKAIPLPLNEGLRQLCRLCLMRPGISAWLESNQPRLPCEHRVKAESCLRKFFNLLAPSREANSPRGICFRPEPAGGMTCYSIWTDA